jgi:hypothetical protein
MVGPAGATDQTEQFIDSDNRGDMQDGFAWFNMAAGIAVCGLAVSFCQRFRN